MRFFIGSANEVGISPGKEPLGNLEGGRIPLPEFEGICLSEDPDSTRIFRGAEAGRSIETRGESKSRPDDGTEGVRVMREGDRISGGLSVPAAGLSRGGNPTLAKEDPFCPDRVIAALISGCRACRETWPRPDASARLNAIFEI
jgi:hypothetical protein